MKKLVLFLTVVVLAGCNGPDRSSGTTEEQYLYEAEQTFAGLRGEIDTHPWSALSYRMLRRELADPAFREGPETDWQRGLWCRDAALYYRISRDGRYVPEVLEYLGELFLLDDPETPLFPDTARLDFRGWFHRRKAYFAAYELLKTHPLLKPYNEIMNQRMEEVIREESRLQAGEQLLPGAAAK